jgi:hypothetical protein
MIHEHVGRYIAATTKTEKGNVIVDILRQVRSESSSGAGLIRHNPKSGRWSYIGLEKAKDKIGHALRKSAQELHKRQTRGTSKSKQKIRESSSSGSLSSTMSESRSPLPSPKEEEKEEDPGATSSYVYESSGGAYPGYPEEAGSRSYHPHQYPYPMMYPHHHPQYPPTYYDASSGQYHYYYNYSLHHGGQPAHHTAPSPARTPADSPEYSEDKRLYSPLSYT